MTKPSPTARIDEWTGKLVEKYGSMYKAADAMGIDRKTLTALIQRGHAATDRQVKALADAGIQAPLKRSSHWRQTMHGHFH